MTHLDDDQVHLRARRLASVLEPVAAQVYFAPECHERYAALGFAPSTRRAGPVELPDGPAYFASRGSVMGQVPGEVIAAAFAVFNPAAVVPAVDHAWSLTDAPTICAARTAGATAQLTRILGPAPDGLARVTELLEQAGRGLRPEGKPLFAGLLAVGRSEVPLTDAWHLADRLREYRGDVHTAAWTTAGFDATEIGLLGELYWGLPLRTYSRTRAWRPADLDAAEARLVERGLVAGGGFTVEGRAAREQVERLTDDRCRPVLDNLGDDVDELIALLEPWGTAIRAAGGYLPSGPADMAPPPR